MDERKALKAALLLSRVLCAHMEDIDFNASGEGCEVSEDGYGLRYEDVDLHLVDVTGGALLLLRGMILDVAELGDTHPAEVARLLEIMTAMNEAISGFEEETARPFWN